MKGGRRGGPTARPQDYVVGHGDPAYGVTHYTLDLVYSVRSNHLEGHAVLTAVACADLTELALDLHALRVGKVTVDGTRARWTVKGDRIRVRPVTRLRAGTPFELAVTYSGRPVPVRQRHLGTAGWEELSDGVIVAGQPHGAPSWFPCNDRPGDKASYTMRITAPSSYRVVANGRLVETHRRSSATQWTFEQRQPMAPYLATVQIGDYAWLDLDADDLSVPVGAAVPPRLVDAFSGAFGRQVDMVRTFARLFGDYPFDTYSVVVTDDDLEIPLESQSLSTFGANHVHEEWGNVRLVAHELAHQWFGNSLTVGSWADIWLHEGFACYAEWLWSEESGGSSTQEQADKHWTRLAGLDQDLLLADPGPELMFDDRVYKRGALLLHALRTTVGDQAFFDLLRAWTAEHAYGTVSTELFTRFASERTGRDLGRLFTAWLTKTRLPELPRKG